jgi:hypothetical protein
MILTIVLLFTLDLLAVSIYFGFNASMAYIILNGNPMGKEPPVWMFIAIQVAPDFYFVLGNILNLCNWTNYQFKISQVANPTKNYKCKIICVNAMAFLYFLFWLSIFAAYMLMMLTL